VLEWWRVPPELRARPGRLALPNPFRRGLDAPLVAGVDVAPAAAGDEAAPIVEHAPAPARPASAGTGQGRAGDAPEVVAAVLASAPVARAGSVRVAGGGEAAEEMRKAVADRGVLAASGPVDVVIDVDPTAASVAEALAALGPTGTLVVAGAAGPVDIDVQTLVHRRGTTVAGPGWHDG
jgi:hypothetical protein